MHEGGFLPLMALSHKLILKFRHLLAEQEGPWQLQWPPRALLKSTACGEDVPLAANGGDARDSVPPVGTERQRLGIALDAYKLRTLCTTSGTLSGPAGRPIRRLGQLHGCRRCCAMSPQPPSAFCDWRAEEGHHPPQA